MVKSSDIGHLLRCEEVGDAVDEAGNEASADALLDGGIGDAAERQESLGGDCVAVLRGSQRGYNSPSSYFPTTPAR
jgi:hypothetical protein